MADINGIKSLLEQAKNLSPSGFAIAFHIRLTSPDFLFQTYPKEWIDIYSEKGFVMVDPTVRWGFSETGAIRWSDLEDMDDVGVLKQSITFGMTYGVTVANDSGDSRSLASFSRADREYTDEEIVVLTDLVQDLHDQTASKTGMAKDLQTELHNLSVATTHPAATDG